MLTLALYQTCSEDIMPLTQSWEKAIPQQAIPKGLVGIKAADCGVCHQAHYKEWSISTHAHAWTDLQFQAEIAKESSPYLCINCHIPLQNQQEYIVTGLRNGDVYKPVKQKNNAFDPTFQLEGISCATCHVRDGHIIGSIGSELAPHPVKKDPTFLNETLCISCHNATAVVTPELVCTFETGDEWKNGPYFGNKNCISCHMDTISRHLVGTMGIRKSHRHWFAGSGIPKLKGAETKGLNGLDIKTSKIKSIYTVNDSLLFNITLTNANAGHRLPSGDPERFYLINQMIENEAGKIIKTNTDRIGEKWEWYPTAKKLGDNNLNIGESRTYTLRAPSLPKGRYKLSSKVTKHRMDAATAKYNKLGDEYPTMITVMDTSSYFLVK